MKREALGVEQQEVDEAFCGFSKSGAERVQVGGLDRDAGFEANVGGRVPSAKKRQPAASSSLLILMRAVAS
jgi:hypothetical protein